MFTGTTIYQDLHVYHLIGMDYLLGLMKNGPNHFSARKYVLLFIKNGRSQMCNTCITRPDVVVEVNGKPVLVTDIADPSIRALFGVGHDPVVIAYRERHPGIGLYDPETCLYAACTTGVWINFGENLVCQGCGLDCT